MINQKSITIPNSSPLCWRGGRGEAFKIISLCNILITPNKKGDRCYCHRPKLIRNDPHVLEAQRCQVGEIILATFFNH